MSFRIVVPVVSLSLITLFFWSTEMVTEESGNNLLGYGGEMNTKGLEFEENFDGLKIAATVDEHNDIIVRGVFRTFVRCGSQRAIWQGFSSHLTYFAKDLETETQYETRFAPLSISHLPSPPGPDGLPTPDSYAQMPCDQFDLQYFEISLYEKMPELPRNVGKLEIYMKKFNSESNRVILQIESHKTP